MINKTKQRFLCPFLILTLVALMLALSFLPISAANRYLIDDADCLTDAEEQTLLAKVNTLREQYGMDVVILTVESIGNKTAMAYADDYYDNNGYGEDGVLILWAVNSRDCWISTSGKGAKAFTDGRIDDTFDDMAEYMKINAVNAGFETFLNHAETYFQPEKKNIVLIVIVSFLIGATVALIAVLTMKSGMKTARQKKQAADYVRQGSFNLKESADLFLFNTYTRVKIQQQSNSGGHGGSSMHTSSGGHSHGGGGRKF